MSTEAKLHTVEINGNWYEMKINSISKPTGFKEFTPGSYIFEVPAGITQLKVSGTAGGAGGHSGYESSKQHSGWGGGAGQWVKDYIIDVTPGESLPIEVGEGGEGAVFAWYPGEAGGKTLVGGHLQLKGGKSSHSGGSYNGGPIVWGTNGQKGGDSISESNIYTGAGGGSSVRGIHDESKHNGGAGGDDSAATTTGGAGGIVTSTYGAGGSGGGAGYGGNGGAGGACNGSQSSTGDAHNPAYDGQDAAGLGAGGGGGAAHGRANFSWGHGGNGGDGYLKIEWS